VLGGREAEASRANADRPTASEQVTATQSAPPDPIIVLRDPPANDAIITTRDVVVSGYLTSGMGPVRVGLASRNGKALAFRTVEPTVIGRVEGDSNPTFLVTLPLAGPRDGGTMTLQVVAYDRLGLPLDVVRRQIVIGPVIRRVVGADGLLGGIAIGTPISERDGP
jgi:hypothetical protein